MKIWKLALAPVLMAMMSANASADEGDERERRGPRDSDFRQRLIDEFDEDGDGMLNQEEREKAREKRLAARDRDEGERGRPGREGREGRRGEGREREARDRGPRPDGPPRDRERGPRRDGPPRDRDRGPERDGPPDPAQLFERFDKNGDDQLSRKEFIKLSNMVRRLHERHGPPPRDRDFGPPRDRDSDGPPRRRFDDDRRGPRDRDFDRPRERNRDRPRPELDEE